jgi:hypothetical protein
MPLALEPKYIALNILLLAIIISPTLAGIMAVLGGVGYAVYRDDRAFNAVGNTAMTLSWYGLKLFAHAEVQGKKVMRTLGGSFLDRVRVKDSMYGSARHTTYDIVSINDTLRANSLAEYHSMVETESICNPNFKQEYVAFVKRAGRVRMVSVDAVDESVSAKLCNGSPNVSPIQWIECELRYHMDGSDIASIQHSIDIRDATRYVAFTGNKLFTPQFFRWYGIDAGIVEPSDWTRITRCSAAVIDRDINTHEYTYDAPSGNNNPCTLE